MAASNPFQNLTIAVTTGERIFSEGEIGTTMFIVQSGRIRLFRQTPDGPVEMAQMEKGDFFGEMSLLEAIPRNMSAEALEPSELIEINSTTFDRMIRSNIEVAVRMLRKLSGRLQKAETLLGGLRSSPEIERAVLRHTAEQAGAARGASPAAHASGTASSDGSAHLESAFTPAAAPGHAAAATAVHSPPGYASADRPAPAPVASGIASSAAGGGRGAHTTPASVGRNVVAAAPLAAPTAAGRNSSVGEHASAGGPSTVQSTHASQGDAAAAGAASTLASTRRTAATLVAPAPAPPHAPTPSLSATRPPSPLAGAQRIPQPAPAIARAPQPAPGAVKGPRLVSETGETSFPLSSGDALVGRYDPVTETQPEVDLTLIDIKRSVSRCHARLKLNEGVYSIVEEVGALNGTFVNGVKLITGNPVPLQNGDRISVGTVNLRFHA